MRSAAKTPRRGRASAWDEIESVVASGKEVTIHEAPISAHGFTGSGYIAIDPQTGAGAYLIEGGARGALLLLNFFKFMLGLVLEANDKLPFAIQYPLVKAMEGWIDSNIKALEALGKAAKADTYFIKWIAGIVAMAIASLILVFFAMSSPAEVVVAAVAIIVTTLKEFVGDALCHSSPSLCLEPLKVTP
jgi:hypothetical protein